MKQKTVLTAMLAVLAMALAFGFAFAGCGNPAGGPPGSPPPPPPPKQNTYVGMVGAAGSEEFMELEITWTDGGALFLAAADRKGTYVLKLDGVIKSKGIVEGNSTARTLSFVSEAGKTFELDTSDLTFAGGTIALDDGSTPSAAVSASAEGGSSYTPGTFVVRGEPVYDGFTGAPYPSDIKIYAGLYGNWTATQPSKTQLGMVGSIKDGKLTLILSLPGELGTDTVNPSKIKPPYAYVILREGSQTGAPLDLQLYNSAGPVLTAQMVKASMAELQALKTKGEPIDLALWAGCVDKPVWMFGTEHETSPLNLAALKGRGFTWRAWPGLEGGKWDACDINATLVFNNDVTISATGDHSSYNNAAWSVSSNPDKITMGSDVKDYTLGSMGILVIDNIGDFRRIPGP